jgi:hypothetical protein
VTPLILLLLSAVTPGGPVGSDTLDDAKIVAYAAAPFDKAAKSGKSEVLGIHHGVRVVVDFPCSDICPQSTMRIIRYDLEPGPACDRAGGKTIDAVYPAGPVTLTTRLCVPEIMAYAEGAQ